VQEVRKWRRNSVRYTQLDDMAARLKALEKAASTR
jgi:UDP-3-O-[3-hydroxymyristoyl] glucosamine N-acyltransferase (EC 2.3.1.-)